MFSINLICRGEIQELFEKATRNELEKSISSGDKERQEYMKRILQFLPYHSKEIATLEQLSQTVVTTQVPAIEPEVPKDLQKLLKQYGLLDNDGKPVEIAPLPLSIVMDDPQSTIHFTDDQVSSSPSLVKYSERVKPISVIKAEDYVNFKPLKDLKQQNSTSSTDIESILKLFGLTNSERNSAKKVKTVKPSKSASNDSSYHQMISSYSGLLENMGIATPNTKSKHRGANNSSKNKNHGNVDDYKNLQHLLETIKELEKLNSTLTPSEVEKLNLKNFNFSDSILRNGPDPVLYQNNFSALKNEVKRRQSNDKESGIGGAGQTPLLESSLEASEDDGGFDDLPSPSTTVRSVTSTTKKPKPTTTTERVTTTTESDDVESSTQERKNTLEDELDPIDDPAPLPPPRRSGFYMLFDWNSFFEVGEDENKIKVRFDPKIGDPSRFLPVMVP